MDIKTLPIGGAHSQVEECIASPTSTPYVSKQLVSRVSCLFLYFWWEEQKGEINTSGYSGQVSMPQRCIEQLQVTLANCHDTQSIQDNPTRHTLKRVVLRVYPVCNFTY